MRFEAIGWWAKLTDNLDRIAGKTDVLTVMLQEKGYTSEHAAAEIEKRMKGSEASKE